MDQLEVINYQLIRLHSLLISAELSEEERKVVLHEIRQFGIHLRTEAYHTSITETDNTDGE
jgi:hypothetical protein